MPLRLTAVFVVYKENVNRKKAIHKK